MKIAKKQAKLQGADTAEHRFWNTQVLCIRLMATPLVLTRLFISRSLKAARKYQTTVLLRLRL